MSDLEWRPATGREQLFARARLLARIREFFAARGVLEVTTPLLTHAGVTDPHLESIPLARNGAFLRTSPEYFHKRLLAAGIGDIYEIGPVFRGGESGGRHCEEFTLAEWYRVGWTWQALAEEVVTLIRDSGLGPWPTRRCSWRDLARNVLGLDPLTAVPDQFNRLLAGAPADMDRPEQLDWLFVTRMQPALPSNTITVVCDFPPEQAALARIRPGNPPVAERFEVFIGDLEVANGYQELTDAAEQRRRFEEDNRRRRNLERPAMPPDERLLAALDAGLPECAGVALGIERLLMALWGEKDIARTRAWPAYFTKADGA